MTLQDIEGFDDESQMEYYRHVVETAPAGSILVEIGCFCGRGLVYLGMLAKAANKGLKIIGIDWFQNMSAGAYPKLMANLKRYGVENVVQVIQKPSVEAAKDLADNSIWWAFIDSGHTHEECAAEIRAWMPKVREDGWLAGHDYRMHTVCEVANSLLEAVHHDPKWDNCWWASKQPIIENANIYEETRVPRPPGNTWEGKQPR